MGIGTAAENTLNNTIKPIIAGQIKKDNITLGVQDETKVDANVDKQLKALAAGQVLGGRKVVYSEDDALQMKRNIHSGVVEAKRQSEESGNAKMGAVFGKGFDMTLGSSKDYHAAIEFFQNIKIEDYPDAIKLKVADLKEKGILLAERLQRGDMPPLNGLAVNQWYDQTSDMQKYDTTPSRQQAKITEMLVSGDLGSGDTAVRLSTQMHNHLDAQNRMSERAKDAEAKTQLTAEQKRASTVNKFIDKSVSFAKEVLIPSFANMSDATKADRYEKLEGKDGIRSQLTAWAADPQNANATETDFLAKAQDLEREARTATPDIIKKYQNAGKTLQQMEDDGYINPVIGAQPKSDGKPTQTKPTTKEVDLKTPPWGWEQDWEKYNDPTKKHIKEILARNDPKEIAQMHARLLGAK